MENHIYVLKTFTKFSVFIIPKVMDEKRRWPHFTHKKNAIKSVLLNKEKKKKHHMILINLQINVFVY